MVDLSGTHRFGIGVVFETGLRTWIRNLIPFVLITTLLYSPLIAWALLATHGDAELLVAIAQVNRYQGRAALLLPLLNVLVSSALVYGVVMELRGQRASILRCVGTGLARFLPVIGVGVLTMLAVFGGLLLIIIPGLIALCMLYVTPAVAVLERPGLIGALARSRELTAGHRWEIFGILIILILANFALSTIIEHLLLDPSTITPDNYLSVVRRYVLVDLAHKVLVGSLSAVMMATSYFYLRRDKDGTSAEELSQVFA